MGRSPTQGHPPEAASAASGGDALLERALPFGVREAIRQQLGHLPAELYQLLEVASVLGNEFSSALVAATAKLEQNERDPGEPLSVLTRARDAGVLVERPGGSWRFRMAWCARCCIAICRTPGAGSCTRLSPRASTERRAAPSVPGPSSPTTTSRQAHNSSPLPSSARCAPPGAPSTPRLMRMRSVCSNAPRAPTISGLRI